MAIPKQHCSKCIVLTPCFLGVAHGFVITVIGKNGDFSRYISSLTGQYKAFFERYYHAFKVYPSSNIVVYKHYQFCDYYHLHLCKSYSTNHAFACTSMYL